MNPRIAGLRRIAYEYRGDIDHFGTPLEIRWDDGSIEVFDAGPDGESLRVDTEAWTDPFAEPLSDENRAYVQESGKYVAVGLDDDPTYQGLVGADVDQTDDILDERGKVVGRRWHIGGRILTVETGADDLQVTVT